MAKKFGKGDVAKAEEHRMLYHLTDSHGYAYSIAQNALKSTTTEVSVTYDPNMNHVGGKHHIDFKFVLSRDVISRYGAHHYNDYYRYVGDSSRRKMSHKEQELRIETKAIEPLNEFLLGTVLLFPILSEKGVQWLLYDNEAMPNSLFSRHLSDAPRAVHSIYRQLYEWKKPIWKDKVGTLLSEQEMSFIRDAHEISVSGGTFKDGLIKLAEKYPLLDHWGKMLDPTTAKRQFLAPKLVKMLNGYYTTRKIKDLNMDEVKRLLVAIFEAIGIGNNATTVVMHAIEVNGMLHRATAPVTWGIIIKDLMDGDVEQALSDVAYLAKEDASKRVWHDESDMFGHGTHYGTGFGRL